MDKLSFVPVTTPSAIDSVKTLAEKIWPEYYQPLIGLSQVEYMLEKIQSRQAIQSQINQGSRYYLIQERDWLMGYLAVLPKPSELFLSKLYLTAESRGKGYGRQAMEFVKETALAQNLNQITLTVHKQNPSVQAYHKMGFQIVEPVITNIGGGFVMDDFKMKMIF